MPKRELRKVEIVTENILTGKRETIKGYRVRDARQLRQLERKLAKVYATYNEQIISMEVI